LTAETDLLRAEGVSHVFRDGKKGLDGASLSVRAADFLLLAGRNGAGKTLLAQRLAGLRKPQEGRVLYRGEPMGSKLSELRSKVGIVFQDAQAQVIGQTVFEDAAFGPSNLALPREECEASAMRALERVSMEGMGSRNPTTLSGGELRRLAIAGLLAMGRECLILDEPFANLDYPSIRMVLETLVALHSGGAAIILLTHEIEKALAHATRLAVMDAGKIVFEGDPDALGPGDFAAYGLHNPYRARKSRADLSWLIA
jgi:biotin transport system ATP-binding protein